MESLLDHLKAMVTTLIVSPSDFIRLINDHKAIKKPSERLLHLRVALKLDKFGKRVG